MSFEDFEAVLVLLDGREIKVRRDDGQTLESPLAARGLHALRRHDGEQMADCRRDDVFVVLEVIVLLLKLAERLADVAGDRRFLRDDEGFAHVTRQTCKPRSVTVATYFFRSALLG
jgi:hypothetical protein